MNIQNSVGNPNTHPGYNAFIIEALSDLQVTASMGNWGMMLGGVDELAMLGEQFSLGLVDRTSVPIDLPL
jgi:hypothetical protein